MGRPIKKSRMLQSFGGVKGTIQVTAYKPVGGSMTQDASYIVAQRSSRKFKIHSAADSTESVYLLQAVAPASLAEGEFCVKVLLGDSTIAYVSKFYDRTVHYVVPGTGETGSVPYTLGTAAAEDIKVANQGVIDVTG